MHSQTFSDLLAQRPEAERVFARVMLHVARLLQCSTYLRTGNNEPTRLSSIPAADLSCLVEDRRQLVQRGFDKVSPPEANLSLQACYLCRRPAHRLPLAEVGAIA